jgi:hypothetical protein
VVCGFEGKEKRKDPLRWLPFGWGMEVFLELQSSARRIAISGLAESH